MGRFADRPDTGVHLDRRALTNAIVDRPGLALPAQANGSKRAARAKHWRSAPATLETIVGGRRVRNSERRDGLVISGGRTEGLSRDEFVSQTGGRREER